MTLQTAATALSIGVILGGKMTEKKPTSHKGEDEIQNILRHSGVVSPHLQRLEEIASKMWEAEWKMMRRVASSDPQSGQPTTPSGD